jgi:hypothetical protein
MSDIPDPAVPGPTKAGDRPAVIVDVDAVMMHRRPDAPSPPLWNPARVHPDLVTLIEAFQASGHALIYLSASWKHKQRVEAEQWILQNLPLPYAQLVMRHSRDGRHTSELKSHLYAEQVRGRYRVTCVIEHRLQDVEMWLRHGLTCLCVAQGVPASRRNDLARGS